MLTGNGLKVREAYQMRPPSHVLEHITAAEKVR
jgi:hypothetical protein